MLNVSSEGSIDIDGKINRVRYSPTFQDTKFKRSASCQRSIDITQSLFGRIVIVTTVPNCAFTVFAEQLFQLQECKLWIVRNFLKRGHAFPPVIRGVNYSAASTRFLLLTPPRARTGFKNCPV